MRRIAAGLVALTLAGPLAAASAGPSEAVAEGAARLASAVSALAAEPSRPEPVAALAAAVMAQEAALDALRSDVLRAEARERALTFELERRRPEIGRLLLAMQALGRAAPPAATLHPDGPLGAARAAEMLGWLTPALRAEARALGERLRLIAAARTLLDQGLDDLSAGLAELAGARDALVAALAAAADAPPPQAALARQADSLSALAAGLAGSADGQGGEPLPLRWPVVGAPLRGFGEPDAAGVRRPGLLVEAAPLAVVAAPAAGQVVYAGPFLDYGYVVAFEPRADTLVLLAGIATLATSTGAQVAAGDLLGLLGGRPLEAQEYLMLGRAQTGETPAETLYIELRHGQGPVDPSTWFEDRNG